MSVVGNLKKLALVLVLALVVVAMLGAPVEALGPKKGKGNGGKGNGGKGKGKNRPVVEQPVAPTPEPTPEVPTGPISVSLTSANNFFGVLYALDLDYRVSETVVADPSILTVPTVFVDNFIDRELSFTSQQDVMDLSRLDADTTLAGNQAFRLVDAFSGTAGELTMEGPPTGERNNTQNMKGDIDGDGTADFTITFTVQAVILDISDNLIL